jgi:hypothetical protein
MTSLVQFLIAHTSDQHRILLEDQLRLWQPVDGESIHWTPLLPLWTGRSFVGGLYELAPIPHNYVSFGDFHLAGRRIDRWSPVELRSFLQTYNVGWVLTWSRGAAGQFPKSTDVFRRLPFCEEVARLPRTSSKQDEQTYFVFRVRLPMSWTLSGTVQSIQQSYNRLVLYGLQPKDGRIDLSFHFDPHWVPSEPVVVEPLFVGSDPVPLVRIWLDQPLEQLELSHRCRPCLR